MMVKAGFRKTLLYHVFSAQEVYISRRRQVEVSDINADRKMMENT